ncbi:MAG: hypothetical protein M0T85_01810 [Dehalococcoidales bacterium]|nr:hypothetical protein [Dehalococcoidales bacterium]
MGEESRVDDGRIELILRGDPEMLDAFIWALGEDLGCLSALYKRAPSSAVLRERRFKITNREFAAVRLQGLPGANTLLSAWPIDNNPEVHPFAMFAQFLVEDLARLGFVDMPDTPKDPLGFRTPRPRPKLTAL